MYGGAFPPMVVQAGSATALPMLAHPWPGHSSSELPRHRRRARTRGVAWRRLLFLQHRSSFVATDEPEPAAVGGSFVFRVGSPSSPVRGGQRRFLSVRGTGWLVAAARGIPISSVTVAGPGLSSVQIGLLYGPSDVYLCI